MKSHNRYSHVASRLIWALCLILLGQPRGAMSAMEEKFDLLQIGTRTYTNVTVTTKAKTYIFMLHSSGMANIKVAELSPDTRQKLGYDDTDKPKAGTNAASVWATQTIAKMESPRVKEVEDKVQQRWRS